MTLIKARSSRHFAALLLLALAGVPAVAQEKQTQSARLPQAFEGLGVSSNDPIQFEAEALEVREQDRTAIFTGNVVVRQNETVLKTASLIVTYAAENAGGGAQQVQRLEAKGDVLVTSGPQTASGDQAVFDTAANTIVVTGNVVLTQGANVIRGPRLVIDIDSGQAKMSGGRVQMLIEPRSLQDGNGG
ncbi:MAG TPA: LptA/OstA family protein [Methylomirabilota bacterium]|nr:LptA/OstA family protein [Methylomirabilota bacterium]